MNRKKNNKKNYFYIIILLLLKIYMIHISPLINFLIFHLINNKFDLKKFLRFNPKTLKKFIFFIKKSKYNNF